MNERALEAQPESDATEAKLQAERDESLLKMARIHIPENQFGRIDVNQAAVITVQNRNFPGRAAHIDPHVQKLKSKK